MAAVGVWPRVAVAVAVAVSPFSTHTRHFFGKASESSTGCGVNCHKQRCRRHRDPLSTVSGRRISKGFSWRAGHSVTTVVEVLRDEAVGAREGSRSYALSMYQSVARWKRDRGGRRRKTSIEGAAFLLKIGFNFDTVCYLFQKITVEYLIISDN